MIRYMERRILDKVSEIWSGILIVEIGVKDRELEILDVGIANTRYGAIIVEKNWQLRTMNSTMNSR